MTERENNVLSIARKAVEESEQFYFANRSSYDQHIRTVRKLNEIIKLFEGEEE